MDDEGNSISTQTVGVTPVFNYHWNDTDQCYYGRFDFWQEGQTEIMMKADGMDMVNIFKRFGMTVVRDLDV